MQYISKFYNFSFLFQTLIYPAFSLKSLQNSAFDFMHIILTKVVSIIAVILSILTTFNALRGCLHETLNKIYPKRNFNPP